MMATVLRRQLERAERVIHPEAARAVPCALHALAAVTPTPAGAELWEGACIECGAAIFYHSTGEWPRREREFYREVYRPGADLTPEALTASRRYLAWLAWAYRNPRRAPAPPRDSYARALDAEVTRRSYARWLAYWQGAPADVVEMAGELFAEDFPLEELEAIIWPPA